MTRLLQNLLGNGTTISLSTYDALGNVATMTDARSHTTQSLVDGFGRQDEVRVLDGSAAAPTRISSSGTSATVTLSSNGLLVGDTVASLNVLKTCASQDQSPTRCGTCGSSVQFFH